MGRRTQERFVISSVIEPGRLGERWLPVFHSRSIQPAGRTEMETEMTMDPTSVVSQYFSRMRAGDVSVIELFHDDATLVGLGTTRSGKEAIREFYQGVIERAGPSPRSAGPLLASGPRVAAEVFIDLPQGQVVHAVDIFVVEEGRIRSLSYFLCAHSA